MESLKTIENQIELAVEQYKKEVSKILSSADPIYKDPDKVAFEIAKLKQVLNDEVNNLKAQYQAAADEAIAEAEKAVALSTVTVSQFDRNVVDSRLDEFVADVALAYNDDDKQAAYDRLLEALKYFDRAKLIYMRKALSNVIARIGGDKTTLKNLRALHAELQDIKTPEQERLEKLKVLKESGGDLAFRTLKRTHITFGNKPVDVTKGN
jgi:hypothetical protein